MKPYPPEIRAAALAAYAAGGTAAKVAKEFHVSDNTVLLWTAKAGITRPPGRPPGRRRVRPVRQRRRVDPIALEGGRWVPDRLGVMRWEVEAS